MKFGLGVAVVAAAVLAGGPSAFAFQFVNPDTNPDGTSTKFSTDLDQQSSPDPNHRFQFKDGSNGNANAGSLKFGNTTLQFGMSGGSGNYGPSPALQERFLQSPAARTVPSQGW
jgi:hypothetical protein